MVSLKFFSKINGIATAQSTHHLIKVITARGRTELDEVKRAVKSKKGYDEKFLTEVMFDGINLLKKRKYQQVCKTFDGTFVLI
jgi:hypothetical protein